MDFDTKIKVILRKGLKPWQELNVTAFLMSGIAGIAVRGPKNPLDRITKKLEMHE
jgi:hypothetical protein